MCVLNFTRWKICRSEYFVDLSKTKFDDGGYRFCNSLMSWMGSFQHHHFDEAYSRPLTISARIQVFTVGITILLRWLDQLLKFLVEIWVILWLKIYEIRDRRLMPRKWEKKFCVYWDFLCCPVWSVRKREKKVVFLFFHLIHFVFFYFLLIRICTHRML